MNKHNILAKKIKKQFISINESIESYFNNLRALILNTKKTKIYSNNKVILFPLILVILLLSYFSIPVLYDKDIIQTRIENQIQKKYNIKIKFSDDIKYVLLPKPHFSAKNVSIIRKGRVIANTENLKILMSINKFFKVNKINLKNLIFTKTDFNIYTEDLSFFFDLLKTEPNENKIIIRNSNIFFKNQNDEVLFINKIKKIEFFYDSNNLENVLISKNEIFKIPFKLRIENDKFNKEIISIFDSKKIRLNLENKVDYNSNNLKGILDVLFINKNTSLNYEIKKDSLIFSSINLKDNYKGTIDFKPFYFLADFNYEGFSTKNLFSTDNIFIDLFKNDFFNSKSLNANIDLNIKDVTNIDELNNLSFNIGINQGKIDFSGSNIFWKESLKITLIDSLMSREENEIYLIGKILIDFNEIKNFYRSFQIKKSDRKDIRQIQIDFIYNFDKQEISFDNAKVDDVLNSNLQNFLEDFNSKDNRIFNKITFKNFINNFFKIYAG